VSLLAQVFGENNLFRTRAGGRVRERSLGSGKSSESREDSKGLREGSGGGGGGAEQVPPVGSQGENGAFREISLVVIAGPLFFKTAGKYGAAFR
jgi:hypothetical protein